MEVKNTTTMCDGGATVEISVNVDEDAFANYVVAEKINAKLDEINGEVI